MGSSECDIITSESFDNNNIRLEIDSRLVAYLILNRHTKHNALTNAMILGIDSALDFVENYSPRVKILVLKANGSTFCAGADLKAMQQMINYDYQENYQDAFNLALVLDKLNNYYCPTIAMVQGAAYGGGVGLICCCDFAIAHVQAEFCLSEVKLGLIPAVISPYLIATMGFKSAMRYILSAEKFNAKRALELFMLTEVIEASDNNSLLNNSLHKIVNNLLDNGPIAMQQAKNLLKNLYSKNDINIIPQTVEAIANIRISEEGQEGLLSFINKRQPNWIIK